MKDFPEARLKGLYSYIAPYETWARIAKVKVTRSIPSEKSRREMTNILFSDNPLAGTVEDPLMGQQKPNKECGTCSNLDCGGHYGLMPMPYLPGREPNKDSIFPIFFPGEIVKTMWKILKCLCIDCGRLLMLPKMIEHLGLDRKPIKERLKILAEKSKNEKKCGHGFRFNNKNAKLACGPPVKWDEKLFKSMKDSNDPFSCVQYVRSGEYKTLYPVDVYNIFSNMDPVDIRILGFKSSLGAHPRNMIYHGLPVMPNIARPSIPVNGNMHRHSFTIWYNEIVKHIERANELIKMRYDEMKERGVKIVDVDAMKEIVYSSLIESGDDKDRDRGSPMKSLFSTLATFIQGKKGKSTKLRGGTRELDTITTTLGGKEGLMREHPRTNLCLRTVLGNASEIKYGQLRLPKPAATTLLVEEYITYMNFSYMRNLLQQGEIIYIKDKITEKTVHVDLSRDVEYSFSIGDRIQRKMRNGDWVQFGRQPSLTKNSFLGARAVLSSTNNLGMKAEVDSQLNADNDGDEMNVMPPNSVETRAEVEFITCVTKNTMSFGKNQSVTGLVLNSRTGAYLMTAHNITVEIDIFMDCVTLLENKQYMSTFYYRCTKYGVSPYSGRSLFSILLPEDFNYINEGVIILEGILIDGRITSKHIGGGNGSIVQKLYNDYDTEQEQINFLNDGPNVINYWLGIHNITIGIGDCMSSDEFSFAVENKDIEAILNRIDDVYGEVTLNKEKVVLREKIRTRIQDLGFIFHKKDSIFDEELQYQYDQLYNEIRDFITDGLVNGEVVITTTNDVGDVIATSEPIDLDTFINDQIAAVDVIIKEKRISRVSRKAKMLMKAFRELELEFSLLSTPFDDPMQEEKRVKDQILAVNQTNNLAKRFIEIDTEFRKTGFYAMSGEAAGAKGDLLNFASMFITSAQQFFEGRIQAGGLPFFDPNSNSPYAHGFVRNSLIHGVSPQEQAMMMNASRPGQMNMALDTSKTGEMQRYMARSYENTEVAIDGTVKNTEGFLFSYSFIYDGRNLKNENGVLSPFSPKNLALDINIKNGWAPFTSFERPKVEKEVKLTDAEIVNNNLLKTESELSLLDRNLNSLRYAFEINTRSSEDREVEIEKININIQYYTKLINDYNQVNEQLEDTNAITNEQNEQNEVIRYREQLSLLKEQLRLIKSGVTFDEIKEATKVRDDKRKEYNLYKKHMNDIRYMNMFKTIEKKPEANIKSVPVVKPRTPRRTSNRMTKFELAEIVGKRAKQLEDYAIKGEEPGLVMDVGDLTDTYEIAKFEIFSRAVPISIIRELPNGDIEEWKLDELYFPFDPYV
jgi:DNA-directed RNA polymerase beta' subunit/DNA-directed RNA polymerase subunit K/omega